MTDEELRELIREELFDSQQPAHLNVQDVVRTAVQETLISLGMDASDPMALQQDMHFVREMRIASEKMRSKGLLLVLGLVLTAAIGAMWVGLKATIGS